MKRLGLFAKNLPALILDGWVNLSESYDRTSKICILGKGQIRKVFSLSDDKELDTFEAKFSVSHTT